MQGNEKTERAMDGDIPYQLWSSRVRSTDLKRAVETYRVLSSIVGVDSIERAFVSNTVDDAGEWVFHDAWFFTADCVLHAKDLATPADHECVVLKNSVLHWHVQTEGYDLGATPDSGSRMRLIVKLASSVNMEMYAAQENCARLHGILQEYVVPNVAVPDVTKGRLRTGRNPAYSRALRACQ